MRETLMKAGFFAAAIATVFATSVLATDYEVTIDGKTYPFTQGVKQSITLKDGRRISVSVSDVRTKEFRGYGISFTYPSDMKINAEAFFGTKLINLDTTDSISAVLQVFPAGTTPNKVQGNILAGLKERFEKTSAEPCKRKFGRIEFEGIRLSYTLATLPHQSEVYTMQRNGETVAVLFQCALKDKKKADAKFDMIASTLK